MALAEASSSPFGSFMAKLGAWLQVIPALEIAARVFGITDYFAARHTIELASPDRFIAINSYVRTCTTMAVSTALTGLVLVTVAITACRFRAKWLFKFLRFYGVLILGLSLVVEFGRFKTNLYLPFGLFFLIFALVKKSDFLKVADQPLPAQLNVG